MKTAENEYLDRKELYAARMKILSKKSNCIGWLKVAAVFTGIAVTVLLVLLKMGFLFFLIPFFILIVFIALCIRHNKVVNALTRSSLLHQINRESIARLKHQWMEFPDSGDDMKPENHPYSEDLDIVGRSSLYQYINTATSFQGHTLLAKLLLYPELDESAITGKQKAISELAHKINWRQDFQAMGRLHFKQRKGPWDPRQEGDPFKIIEWAHAKQQTRMHTFMKIFLRLVPMITVLVLCAGIFLDFVPLFIPLLFIVFHIILLIRYNKQVMTIIHSTTQYKEDMKAYSAMLQLFECEKFSSSLLQQKQQALKGIDGRTTSEQIKKLSTIIDMANIRYSSLYLLINIITLWDIYILIALNNWKQKYGINLDKWIHIVAELECFSGFSLLEFNNPQWCTPEIKTGRIGITATALGHPLLGDSRVTNNLDIREAGSVFLITGSNMSGKSTWLRCVGINLVLAYNGAVVCASHFECSLFHIYSVMRIKDDLEKHISSFYAELLKIKEILKIAAKNKPVFFLFDEIFKGTNSIDRHTGARILIQSLSRKGAFGLVSTHDLALGKITVENNKIKNYHFQEYYENGNIKFDYILYPGISQTRNALHLMKMAGLEIEDDIIDSQVNL